VRPVRIAAGRLLTAADLAATFLFAVEGAITASYFNLDWFGVLVISFTTALVGGIARDLLIGYTPPASLRGVVYPLTAFAGAAAVLILDRAVEDIPAWLLQVTDAGGLALFAVVGTVKALDFNLNWLAAIMLGTMSAIGGGVVRDVLLNEIPFVLRQDVYAVAAVAGAATTVLARRLGASRALAMAVGFAVCFVLRITGLLFGWNLPQVSI
jgi:uncharacterized membrane protein YeiH